MSLKHTIRVFAASIAFALPITGLTNQSPLEICAAKIGFGRGLIEYFDNFKYRSIVSQCLDQLEGTHKTERYTKPDQVYFSSTHSDQEYRKKVISKPSIRNFLDDESLDPVVFTIRNKANKDRPLIDTLKGFKSTK